MLIQDLHVRIINAATGELIRELTIDPTRDYQPLGRPLRPPNQNDPEPIKGSGSFRCLETPHGCAARDLNPEPSDP